MARLRTIKPGFFTNEELADCDPLARLAFAGLWCLADREGRLEDRPKRIKAEILPFDDVDMDKLLDELAAHGFIERYRVDGRRFIRVTKFLVHQRPHVREAKSEIPLPPGTTLVVPAPDLDNAATGRSSGSGLRSLGSGHSEDPPTPRTAGGRNRRNSHLDPEDRAVLSGASERV